MTKKKTFEVSINNLPAALKRLDLPAEQVQVIEDYKKQFPFLLEEGENVLVSLDQLWEALDTPYYTPPGTGAELSGTVKLSAKELKYKRRKFTQWRDDVAIKEIDGEPFSRMVPTGKTKKKETFVTIEDAKIIAMMAPGEQGRKIRRYFVTVEKVCKILWQYNFQRHQIENKSNEVYKLKLAQTGYKDFDVAAKDKIRFNSLVKQIAGARNVKETDLENYHHIQHEVFNAVQRGCTDSQILAFYLGDEAA
ncbi:TPA: hypothetical protein ACWW9G_000459 [Klebsiella pneumoniae]|uniref:hypothetical protein n=1 Tax=Klebsiella pneumoniae TaxID=573 RepID=UPI000BB60185|nr:hypothetical protein [Klebsiella pneumoniae]NBZ13554.1 hypothetical protein [Klebsiella pneumoniae]NBZ56018.1 hypothetical protein [Klebsiella pneumoniae]PBP13505.1 hypothetical protein CI705_06915 [Klebsiella pneumoniae subsp. pneumoniae]HBW9604156.1 hypothetical protein [Klebsiella pneumoniae]HBZ4069122.1 hypothetical protein [Klebsiella pneumoniae]